MRALAGLLLLLAPCALAGAQAAAASAPAAASAAAPATQSPPAFARFLEGLRTLRAEFTQVAVDSSGKEVESGSGKLLLARPGRFRWEFQPADGDAQLVVADGRNLWFYDSGLQQATVKPEATSLGATPILLLSAAPAQLQAAFVLEALPEREGVAWVGVTPRDASADFASAELGLAGGELAGLVIRDKLGQVVRLTFARRGRNAPVAEADLRFSPPAGADVIGKPLKP